MATQRQVRALGDITHELDLVIYRLERSPPADIQAERERVRRDLERLRERLTDLLREIE